jgi:hypothetical protein
VLSVVNDLALILSFLEIERAVIHRYKINGKGAFAFTIELTKMRVHDNKLLRILSLTLPEHLIRQKFLQSFSYFAVLESSNVFDSSCGRRKPMQAFQFQSTDNQKNE